MRMDLTAGCPIKYGAWYEGKGTGWNDAWISVFDVTHIEEAQEGDEILLFGRPEDGITADDVASILGTINYEVVCGVSSRVPRLYR